MALWTIEAKHHSIPGLIDLNSALKLVGNIQNSFQNSIVVLNQLNENTFDEIIEEDFEKAMKMINKYFKE